MSRSHDCGACRLQLSMGSCESVHCQSGFSHIQKKPLSKGPTFTTEGNKHARDSQNVGFRTGLIRQQA
eukprot:scaffold7457_cov128-Skeletonema_dohrnii-CCMP3373.AAC.9